MTIFEMNFLVLEDPGPDPLARGTALSTWEVYYGLRYGSLNAGTRLYDEKSGLTHRVVRLRGGWNLAPPSERLPFPLPGARKGG